MRAPSTAIGPHTGFEIRAKTAWIAVVLFWLLCAGMLIWGGYRQIGPLTLNDPDDALRLVEVRDWLAGQSWFDVTQYRSEPPDGAPMHWSRLVDIPIAALIRLSNLVMPMPQAERVALVVVPLLLLLGLAALVHRLTIRLTGHRLAGVTAVAMLMLSLGALIQFKPLRIDHHGWQILLGTLGVLLLLRAVEGSRRHAALGGAIAALSLVVAIEGLPLVVAMGAVMGLLYVRDADRATHLLAYLAMMLVSGAILLLIMLGWPAAAVPWCDALSPAYLAPVTVALLSFAFATRLLPQSSVPMRLAGLALAGGGAALTFRLATPICAAGPFAALDPLVARLWYQSILEGLPIWYQPLDLRLLLPLPSVLGLIAVVLAIRLDDPKRRDMWTAMLVVQMVTFLVSQLVMRSMGLAHVLALPATAWLFLRVFARTRTLSSPSLRVLAGVASFVITPIGAEVIMIALLPQPVNSKTAANAFDPRSVCTTAATLRGLNALPASRLFTPLDIGPHLLLFTHHSVIATGHHRARWGMKAVISAFIAPPQVARDIVRRTGSTYIALCDQEPEVKKYAKLYPASLAASLLKGQAPDWLAKVPMRPGENIRVWRIER